MDGRKCTNKHEREREIIFILATYYTAREIKTRTKLSSEYILEIAGNLGRKIDKPYNPKGWAPYEDLIKELKGLARRNRPRSKPDLIIKPKAIKIKKPKPKTSWSYLKGNALIESHIMNHYNNPFVRLHRMIAGVQ